MQDWKNNKPFLITLALLIVSVLSSILPWISFFKLDSYVAINGKKYSPERIEKEAPTTFQKYYQQKSEAERQMFYEFADSKILDLESAETKLSNEEILRKGFQPREISEQEIVSVYNQYKAQLGGKSLDETRELIRTSLASRDESIHAQEVKKKLVEKYKVDVRVPEKTSRADVAEAGNPVTGNQKAKVTIVEFSDLECPYCKRSQEVNYRLRNDYKDKIKWVFRDFPLPFHENAMFAHVALNCSISQGKYWDFMKILFENSDKLSKDNVVFLGSKVGIDTKKLQVCIDTDKAIKDEIQKDLADGQKYGVTGTPAFFINGIFINGAQPYEKFKEVIDRELSN